MLQVHGGSAESSGLGDLFDSKTHHLTTAHSVFHRHWEWLIDLEAKETQVRHLRSPCAYCINSFVIVFLIKF